MLIDWHIVLVSKEGKIQDYYTTTAFKSTAVGHAKTHICTSGLHKEGYEIQVVMEVEKESYSEELDT